MKKRTGFIVFLIAAVLFICGTAISEGQVNSRRRHVEDTIRWRNIRRRSGIYLSSVTLSISCISVPTLSSPGEFLFTVENDDGSEWVYECGISDTGRDPSGYIYFSPIMESNIFTGITFYSAGEYELYVFLYREGDTENCVASAVYAFTIDDESTLEAKAQEIVNECRVTGDNWQTALNLHDWLTGHTYYDENYEYYGADVLFRGKGVCDAYSKAFKLLCNTAGISVERVTSRAQNHAWNVIRFGDTWYQVDVTWDDPSGGTAAVSGRENYNYFCLSDDVMYLDHKHYDEELGVICPSLAMNYFIKMDLWEQFGKYNASEDTVIEYCMDHLEQGHTNVELSLNDWGYKYRIDGNTIYRTQMKAVWYGIYIYGMKQTVWALEDGGPLKVDIELHYSDRYVSFRITGWDIAETGTLVLPASAETVEENAFEKTMATTVVIPGGCTEIKAGAFRDSGIRTVYVPDSRVVFADDTFEGCRRIIFILESALVEGDPLDEYAFEKGYLVVDP